MVKIVCSGGASNVAVYFYSLKQLFSMYKYDVKLHGTSGGAVLILAYMCGRLDEAERLLTTLDRWQRLRPPWKWTWGVYSLDPLRTEMLKALEGAEVQCEGWVHVVDPSGGRWGAGKYELIALHDLPNHAARVEAVLCSCTQRPLIMAPSYHQGRLLIDGGTHHPMGVIDPQWDDVIYYLSAAPLTHGPQEYKPPVRSVFRRSLDLLLEAIGIKAALSELRALIAGDHDDDLKRIRTHALKANVTLVEPFEDPGDPFDFSPALRHRRLNVLGFEAWHRRQKL